jgi:glycosyltransferase involved in cell wall biosynthesis
VALTAFLYAAWVIYRTLTFGEPVRGYPSLMVVILFLGGVQLMAIGIIGEYLGRMFDETKGRPLYLLNRYEPAAPAKTAQSAAMGAYAESMAN